MPKFIVTVEFTHTDDVAYEVEAADRGAAVDHALDRLIEDVDSDRPEAGSAQTIEEFESDWGTWTPGMFEAL